MRHVARKVAAVEGGLVWFRGGFTIGNVVSGQVDLYMTSIYIFPFSISTLFLLAIYCLAIILLLPSSSLLLL